MTWTSRQWKKLQEKKYREEFVVSQAKRAIPFQLRALMRKKHISQQELADKAGLPQGTVSRAANPAYGNLSLNTILRVAAGLDVAFIGVFVPFSKLVDFYEKISEERLAEVPTFTEEDAEIAALEREPRQSAAELHSKVLLWNQRPEAAPLPQKVAQAQAELSSQLPFAFGPKLVWAVPAEDIRRAEASRDFSQLVPEPVRQERIEPVPPALERQPVAKMAARR